MRYVYPPRPQSRMEPRLLPIEERNGTWVAQYKYNGNRCVIQVTPESVVTLFNRHGRTLTKMALTPSIRKQILGLNLESGKGYVFDAECMNAKTSLHDTLVLYDILWSGNYLRFVGQMKRLEMLAEVCRNPNTYPDAPLDIALQVSPNIWMAPTFQDHFLARYTFAIKNEHLEGVVLRSKKSSLDNSGDKEYEIPWIIRVRKPGKTHGEF